MNDHKQLAIDYFKQGYSCSQSVFAAFSDITGMSPEMSLKLSSSFGGGIGGMKETCGVVTGAFMVLGIRYGSAELLTPEDKKKFYAFVQTFSDEFNKSFGTLICRKLEEDAKSENFLTGEQDNEFYRKKPCAVYVEYAAELLDEYLGKY